MPKKQTMTHPTTNVVIPDAYLAKVVREALDLEPSEPITESALEELKELYATLWQITDLTGLEKATGLIGVSLFGTVVKDLGPLSGLEHLEWIDLCGAPVSDVGPLASLKKLKMLVLRDTLVSDVSRLAGLTYLRRLNISGTLVSDVSPLAALQHLDILK